MPVTLERLCPTAQHAALIAEASSDSELVHNTYLPGGMTTQQAIAWIAGQGPLVFVVGDDDQPVGLLSLSPGVSGIGPEHVPDAAYETETWMLRHARGAGVAGRAWEQLEAQLREHHPEIGHLVGVVWDDNAASHRRLSKSGYQDRGLVWWGGDDPEAGWCRLWVKALL